MVYSAEDARTTRDAALAEAHRHEAELAARANRARECATRDQIDAVANDIDAAARIGQSWALIKVPRQSPDQVTIDLPPIVAAIKGRGFSVVTLPFSDHIRVMVYW